MEAHYRLAPTAILFDERLKNIYGYYGGGLDELMQIKPIRYSLKSEDYITVGFSAEYSNCFAGGRASSAKWVFGPE